jgi:hypothetical protein
MNLGLNHSRETDVFTCVSSSWFCDQIQGVLSFFSNKIICPDMPVAPNKGKEVKDYATSFKNKSLTH